MLRPVAYESNTGQWIQHPDLRLYFEKDIFVAVTPRAMIETDRQSNITLARGETVTLGEGEYQLSFTRFDTDLDIEEIFGAIEAEQIEIAVAAVLDLTEASTGQTQQMRPVYAIRTDRSERTVPSIADHVGLRFTGMNVETGEIDLVLEGITGPDYVVVQAYEKPAISLVWIGLILLTGGFVMSIIRRAADANLRTGRQEI